MLVLEACGKCGSNLWTTNMTRTLRDRAEPSSNASKTNFRTSSCIAEKYDTISVFNSTQYMLLFHHTVNCCVEWREAQTGEADIGGQKVWEEGEVKTYKTVRTIIRRMGSSAER
jgi:hypothetical protein